ncbi:MAG: histidinol-phosphate transaminase [Kangiellaceae bacterium]|nr:histidinol-phosphate transaminase [Kangiellaceae bacterium]
MSCDYFELANPGIQKLHPYLAGKPVSELERELGISNIVKLASNENPIGLSEQVKIAIEKEFTDGCRYPDANGHYLKAAISEKIDVSPNQITLGNGSNDVLEMIAKVYVQSHHEVIFAQHAFCVYPIVAQSLGATLVEVPAKEWGNDLPKMLEAITDKTRMIFVANPNNPTGTWLGESELKAFVRKVPKNVIVVIDEAYTEYVTDDSIPNTIEWLSEFENLVVTRTFSKAYGLASLRLGYAVTSEEICGLLNRVRQPFNVNSFSLAAGIAVLNDEAYLQKAIEVNKGGMQQLIGNCEELDLKYIPSAGNFLTVDMGQNAMPIYQKLLLKGVIVRPVANYSMPNHLRISIGLEFENQKYVDSLTQILS